jgi:outer membrane biosynthesis protein TonB
MAKQDPSSLEASKTSQTAPTAPTAQALPPHRIHVKEAVERAKLIHTVSPMYPPLTDKRVNGTVVLHVLIGKNGAVKSAKYVSGPETCGWYAVKAVLQWRYEPTLMNSVPVEVNITVSVVFPHLGSSTSGKRWCLPMRRRIGNVVRGGQDGNIKHSLVGLSSNQKSRW